MNEKIISPIAFVRSDFKTKFGVPRQSGLVPELMSYIVFEPEFRVREALRGLEGFSHLWLIWGFSENKETDFSPTVRPPRLGGNTRIGVFATRSPFRPNGLGLSSVRLEKIIRNEKDGDMLLISGGDMTNGTPVYDIKPYIPYCDSHAEALGGFTDPVGKRLSVDFPPELEAKVPKDKLASLTGVLSCDMRPSYSDDPNRVYGFCFAGLEVKFKGDRERITVVDIIEDEC